MFYQSNRQIYHALYSERKTLRHKSSLIFLLQVTRTQWLWCHCAQLELKKKLENVSHSLFSFFCVVVVCNFVFFSSSSSFLLLNNLRFTQNTWPHSQAAQGGAHTHTGTVCVCCALIWMYYNKFRRYKIPAQKDTKHRCLHELFRASPVKWNQGRHKARNRGGSRQPEPGHKCCGRTIETGGRERGVKWGSRLWLDTVSVLHGGYVCNVWLNL